MSVEYGCGKETNCKNNYFFSNRIYGNGGLRVILIFPASNPAMELAYTYKNQYDIIAIGPSQVLYNINNQELYEKYGITGLPLGLGQTV